MRLKESVFNGPDTYTFKVEMDGESVPRILTVVVDEDRYFELDSFPHGIPISVYAEHISGQVADLS